MKTHQIGEFVEITDQVAAAVERSSVTDGIALVRSRHTTAAITCNEPDPRLHEDMRDAVYATFPTSRRYRHIEEGRGERGRPPGDGDALRRSDVGCRAPTAALDLGTWQHLYLVELYEPRRREVDVANPGGVTSRKEGGG